MATLTAPEKTTATVHPYRANGKVGLLTREEVAEVEAQIAVILAPTSPAAAPALPKSNSLLARMERLVSGLWNELSGPPMTERERQVRDLAEARHHCYPGMGGL